MRLLACQIDVPPMRTSEERDDHVAATIVRIEHALRKQPADMVVLPELSTIEYLSLIHI